MPMISLLSYPSMHEGYQASYARGKTWTQAIPCACEFKTYLYLIQFKNLILGFPHQQTLAAALLSEISVEVQLF